MSGLAIACAVAQFVDFGTEVLSKGYKISKSVDGATKSNVDVEAITSDIENLSEKMSKSLSLQPLQAQHPRMTSLSRKCVKDARI